MKLADKNRPRGSVSEWREILVTRTQYRISLNTRLLRDFGLAGGERILIAKDEDSRNDWYITLTDRGGSKLRVAQRDQYGEPISIVFSSKPAATEILDSVKAELSAVFNVASKPTRMPDGRDWYRIMTAVPKRLTRFKKNDNNS